VFFVGNYERSLMQISRKAQNTQKNLLIKTLSNLLQAFDEQLWCATVETVTVHSEKSSGSRFQRRGWAFFFCH